MLTFYMHKNVVSKHVNKNERGRIIHLSLICLAMVKKACSTLVAFLADVSRKGIFNESEKV